MKDNNNTVYIIVEDKLNSDKLCTYNQYRMCIQRKRHDMANKQVFFTRKIVNLINSSCTWEGFVKNIVTDRELIFYVLPERYIRIRQRYDNHNMALMLIELLYKRNQINEATYRKIMRKYQIQNRIA